VDSRFPAIEPYDHGWLAVGDGQQMYWEVCGNPDGKPAVVLHGGPGSGCTPDYRRLFDPTLYRIVLFDQRGSGRSTPRVGAFTDLSSNTTEHLVRDIEQLRVHLDIDAWLVWGVSWGVTLGLVYTERFPERVTEAVFASVTMTRHSDVHWLYHEVGRYLPEQWDRFRSGVPEFERNGDLVAAYSRLLNVNPDRAVRERAAQDWCDWEDAVLSLEPGWVRDTRYDDPSFRMTFARIVTHYFGHVAWLEGDQILRDAHRLAGVEGVLIHGQFDLGGPADTAWQLARAWPDAELRLVATGHGGGDEMTSVNIEATNRFARDPDRPERRLGRP